MSTPHPRRFSIAAVAFWLALALIASAGPAFAQDFDDEEEAKTPLQQQMMNQFAWDDSNFDMWVFNNRANGNGRDWFEAQLLLKLDALDRSCHLTDTQKTKLRLAGRGDVKRFFDLYDEKFRKFQTLKHDQEKINEIMVEIRPLQTMLATGAFGRGSLFQKTLKTTLTTEQVAENEKANHDRRTFRYRARLELAVGMLDSVVGMSEDQRRRLGDILLAETKLPARTGQYEYYLVMYQAALLPSEKLRPIFDDAQWKVVSPMFQQFKGYESFLRAQGLLEEKDKDAPNPQ